MLQDLLHRAYFLGHSTGVLWRDLCAATGLKRGAATDTAGVPSCLFFSVTNICNAKCSFCAYRLVKHPTGVMHFEVFRRAIDEYVALGGTQVSFTPTLGDPLIDPGLFDKIAYAVSLPGIRKAYFYSNGILLGRAEAFRRLVDSGLHEVHLSMTALDEAVFERVYGVDTYRQLTEGLDKLLSYNRERGEPLRIVIQFRSPWMPSRTTATEDYLRIVKPRLSARVTQKFMMTYDNWGGTIKQEDLEGVMRMRRVPRVKTLPCQRVFDAMILYDGSVRLCACRVKDTEFDDLVVGKLGEAKLQEILEGPTARAVRESFGRKQLCSVCQGCSFYVPASRGRT